MQRGLGGLLLWLMLPWSVMASEMAVPVSLAENGAAAGPYMGIELLGTLRLSVEPQPGVRLGGISGLAWDEDDDVLYALADTGELYHLQPLFAAGRLVDVQLHGVYPLQDAQGQPLRFPWNDAEGLALLHGANGRRGDSELVIAFEARPRIEHYRVNGRRVGAEPLPAPLADVRFYSNPNKALESVVKHPRYGLLTAPEWSMTGDAAGSVTLYSLQGLHWRYPLASAPNSGLVDLALLPDGSLLALERGFVALTRPLVITLRRIYLPADPAAALTVREVAVFSSAQGWLLDNFEGLTYHRDGHFFMVSDDNRHILQNTLLVYFRLRDPGF